MILNLTLNDNQAFLFYLLNYITDIEQTNDKKIKKLFTKQEQFYNTNSLINTKIILPFIALKLPF